MTDAPDKKPQKKSTLRFMALYKGLQRAYGIYKNNRAKTLRQAVTYDDYEKHLNGDYGIGVVPVNEDNLCYFGVIDIDINDINHQRLVEQVEFYKYPLIVCRSKSGGAHLYTFTKKPVSARFLRKLLAKWASELGYGDAEVFPKQDALHGNDVGNWINLPYFDMIGNCIRYAIDKQGAITLPKFLDVAENLAGVADLESEYGEQELEPDGMPPCLSHFYHSGVVEGGRNEVIYSMGVFARKSDQDDIEDFLFRMNFKMLDPPLPAREVKTIIASVKRANYQYKCKHPMFKQHCNAEVCKRLKFGVGSDMCKDGDYDEHMIGCLTKYLTVPVRWSIDINGVEVELNSEEIMNYQKVRCMSMERANIIAPPMKQESWLLILKERLSHVKEVEAPEDASSDGDIAQILEEFIQIAERGQQGRDDLLRGIPVRDTITELGDEVPVVMFRSQDFLTYIKRRKINLFITNNVLWMLLRKMGIGHSKVRVRSAVVQVWWVHTLKDYSKPILEPLNPILEI
jgi:hypothetical protein